MISALALPLPSGAKRPTFIDRTLRARLERGPGRFDVRQDAVEAVRALVDVGRHAGVEGARPEVVVQAADGAGHEVGGVEAPAAGGDGVAGLPAQADADLVGAGVGSRLGAVLDVELRVGGQELARRRAMPTPRPTSGDRTWRTSSLTSGRSVTAVRSDAPPNVGASPPASIGGNGK